MPDKEEKAPAHPTKFERVEEVAKAAFKLTGIIAGKRIVRHIDDLGETVKAFETAVKAGAEVMHILEAKHGGTGYFPVRAFPDDHDHSTLEPTEEGA